MSKTLALPVHRHNAEYCAKALLTHDCPENHNYTLPVGVPESHADIVSALRDHLFLARVNQETPAQFLANVAELDKRYLQVGQYIAGHNVAEGSSSRIVAVTR